MGLFASFLENQKSESTPANSANPANLTSHHAQNSQLSRDSQVATLKAEIAGQRKFATFATGKSSVDAQPQPVDNELEERKGMAMASVPGPYLATWARLQCHPPMGASNEERWQVAASFGSLEAKAFRQLDLGAWLRKTAASSTGLKIIKGNQRYQGGTNEN